MAKAVRMDHYGGPDVLYVADIDVEGPSPGEVLVAVKAAGINPGEIAIRLGLMEDRFPATFPQGEGSDLAGVVSAVGQGVRSFAVGDEVLGWSDRRSSHAQFVSVPEDHLIRKPASLSFEVAGALFVAGSTAYAAVEAVGVKEGDTLVVSAAAGGVGSITSQLAKARGAKVIGIASHANYEWLSSIGVIPVAYGPGLADRIKEATPSGVDAFIDTFGEEYVYLALDLGVKPDRIDTVIAFEAAAKTGILAIGSAGASNTTALGEIANLVASGKISVPIAASYPLDQVKEAYIDLERRHTRGKIVLIP